MQRLEVSGAVRLIYRSLGVKGLTFKAYSRKIKVVSVCFRRLSRTRDILDSVTQTSNDAMYRRRGGKTGDV